ncbi:hypothetical protein Tco_0086259 [Tanacetum coccineum]
MSMEALQAQEDLMKSIESFLKKFNRISFGKTPKVLLQAWDNFFEVKHAQSEEVQELLSKLVQDVKIISDELSEYINTPAWNRPLVYCDDDDDEDYTIAITPESPTKEPVNSLKIASNRVDRINDEVLEGIHSIPPGIDSFDAESDLVESVLNRDISIDSSPKIDSLSNEFAGELILPKSIPPEIEEVEFDTEGDILFLESLLYDNSSPRPPEALQANSNAIESLPPSHIPVADNDSLMEEIDLFLADDGSIPPGIESDDLLTSYLHRSMIVSALRLSPSWAILQWMWWEIFSKKANQEFMIAECEDLSFVNSSRHAVDILWSMLKMCVISYSDSNGVWGFKTKSVLLLGIGVSLISQWKKGLGSGYHQKDRKNKAKNDKTGAWMGKDCAKSRPSPN